MIFWILNVLEDHIVESLGIFEPFRDYFASMSMISKVDKGAQTIWKI